MYIEKKNADMKLIPSVVNYHDLLKDFASVIKKHLYILYLNEELKEIFTSDPMVLFRRKEN